MRDVARPPAADADTAPELSVRAARVLRQIGGGQGTPGFAGADSELLAELLTAASEAGYLAPAPLLPGLLDAAVRTTALRPAVAAVLGARGRWLAAYRPDWQRVADEALPGRARRPAGIPRSGGRGAGGNGTPTSSRLRDGDPRAARELLAAGWAREIGAERPAMLAVLARGLSPDDEEFLEAALDDRVEAVRATARRLLSRLPGSAFNRRATERAAAVLDAGRGPARRDAAGLRRRRRRGRQGRDQPAPAVTGHRRRSVAAHPGHRRGAAD